MKSLLSAALRYENGSLLVLDQTKLPNHVKWIECTSPEEMCDIIKKLRVRGAPLIGISAAIALALYAEKGKSSKEIEKAAAALRAARPTAVNLAFCIDKMMAAYQASNDVKTLVEMAEALFHEDIELCNAIASHGTKLIEDGDNILTHCNTGKLVTAGVGTALGIIFRAAINSKIHVYVDETRPLLQGARLTAWELSRENIPYTLICDNMAASLMRDGKISKIIVGADRIARNGDFANKIGTYSLAALAKFHHIPFYVAAPYTTIDLACSSGEFIKIEKRPAEEVRGFKDTIWSPGDCQVDNPAFDVTPGDLVTGYILDKGVFSTAKLKEFLGSSEHLLSKPVNFGTSPFGLLTPQMAIPELLNSYPSPKARP